MYIQLFRTFLPFLLSLMICSAHAQVNNLFSRKYKVGESYRYRLTTHVMYNGKPQGAVIAECTLKVVTDSLGIPFDEISWTSLRTIKGADTVADNTAAVSVKPYRVSLHPNGKIDMPRLNVAAMTGPITDFNTFLVAISPQLGALQLANTGDSLFKDEPVKGDFANGTTILKGQDCLAVSIYLRKKSDSMVLVETRFLPPAQNCLSYITEDMEVPVVENGINNFQMVQPAGSAFNVHYGSETFIINSNVRRSDGKLVNATMSNTLMLKTKVQCNSAYTGCQGPFPFRIDRTLQLELLQ